MRGALSGENLGRQDRFGLAEIENRFGNQQQLGKYNIGRNDAYNSWDANLTNNMANWIQSRDDVAPAQAPFLNLSSNAGSASAPWPDVPAANWASPMADMFGQAGAGGADFFSRFWPGGGGGVGL